MVEVSENMKVLIVDDDALVIRALEATLKRRFRVLTAASGELALAALADHPDIAVAIIDQRMPGMCGAELIRHIAAPYPNLVRIILTGYQDIESLKQAINNGGAYRYLEKPVTNDELIEAVQSGTDLHRRLVADAQKPAVLAEANENLCAVNQQLQLENLQLRLDAERFPAPGARIVGSSPALMQVLAAAKRIATTDATVLIVGETGTGKDLLARHIHDQSGRRGATFRAQNCGAVAEHLMEDVLFGHVAGAFTGARAQKKGLFEIAAGGTLFLDEIGECSPSLQARLLRVVEDRVVYRLGDDERALAADVRLIAATNRDLRKGVQAGQFREDLYYRLNVLRLEVPPLRERRTDIRELAGYFLRCFNVRAQLMSGKVVTEIDATALAALERYEYPGNVRELANIMERAWLFADDGGVIALEHVAPSLVTHDAGETISHAASQPADGQFLRDAVGAFKAQYIAAALARNDWNVAATAREIGISRGRLYEEIRELGLQRGE